MCLWPLHSPLKGEKRSSGAGFRPLCRIEGVCVCVNVCVCMYVCMRIVYVLVCVLVAPSLTVERGEEVVRGWFEPYTWFVYVCMYVCMYVDCSHASLCAYGPFTHP